MEKFTFSNQNIDLVSAEVESFLQKEKVNSKDIIRTRLMLEELLLKYQFHMGEKASFTLSCGKQFGRLRIELRTGGQSFDPFEEEDSAEHNIMSGVLSGAGILPTWQYRNGQHILVFSPRKQKPSSALQLAATVFLALLSGVAVNAVPGLGSFLSTDIITPIADTYLGLLTALSSIVIFLSLVWGVISIGDMTFFEKIGKKMLLRILMMYFGLLLCFGTLILPLFPITSAGGVSLRISDLLQVFLDIIPKSVIAPFLEGNPLQIIFLAILVGIGLLALGTKVSLVATFIGQANSVVNMIMEVVCSFIPLLVFSSLFNGLVNRKLGSFLEVRKMILLAVAGILFAILVYVLLCLRKGVRAKVLLKKLLPTFVIALTTASSSAALSTNLDTCDKKLGIAPSVTRFGVPMYQVIFMPVTALEFFVIVLSTSEIYGVAISPSMLIMAVISIVLLSIAAPPIPGAGAAVLTILFKQCGVPPEAIGIAASVDIILEYLLTAGEVFCQQCELIQLSDALGMLNVEKLKKDM